MDPKIEQKARNDLSQQRLEPETISPLLLEAVPYQYAPRQLDIRIESPEFTHICPMTGLPDFGKIDIYYVPDETILELKSLKYYLVQYRQVGIFYEHLVHRILDDIVATIQPKSLRVVYTTEPRGGIASTVEANWPT